DLLALAGGALAAAETLLAAAKRAVAVRIAPAGAVDNALVERHQFAAHGFAWMATYVEALRQLRLWGERLAAAGALREAEALMLQAGFGEYLAQLGGGIALSQVAIARPQDLGLGEAELAAFRRPAVARLTAAGNSEAVRMRLAALLHDALDDGDFGRIALGDEQLAMIRDQFRRFGAERVAPFAHRWHLDDCLIPIEVVGEMAA